MKYNHLGKSGLKVSEISFGSWITFGKQTDLVSAGKLMKNAFDRGINFFDNAEAYARGLSELIMGEILRSFRREDLVLSTKIYWGGEGPNQTGLSRKHLIEGTKNSLRRLQLEYVDLLFCHRPDPETPIEETVLAMDSLVRGGQALYWGTSEWSASSLEEAFQICRELNCIPPSMEQPQYNMLVRDRFEKEYASLYEKHHIGTTTWSPLASGILTGKYNSGIPSESRLALNPALRQSLEDSGLLSETSLEKVKELTALAEDLGGSMAQLAIAWILKNPHVSTVITGATSEKQLDENINALYLKEKLDSDTMKTIETILTREES
ncbi:MAG TPA: aldo/keto reductase [Firmicutes bacterium]|nr:aldo/keto reductase [Bacillota bacterium]